MQGDESRRRVPRGSPEKLAPEGMLLSPLRTCNSRLKGLHWEQENHRMPVPEGQVMLESELQQGASGHRVEGGKRGGLEVGRPLRN